jgi:hypothetical protein
MKIRQKLGIRGSGACAGWIKALAALLLCLAAATGASAQINSAVGPVALSANLPSSLATFISQLSLYAYFTNPASAMADASGHNIPAANMSGSVNGGAFGAFTGTSPFAGTSSITLFSQFVLGFNIPQTRTDTINLRINTTGLGLPSGNYAGLLVIQAQAI